MKAPRHRNILQAALLCGLVAGAAAPSQAAVIVKANNPDDLNLATSWVNNAVPGASDIAQWDATLSDVNNTTNTLGASTNWAGIKILNPAGAITIITNAGGNTLTLGSSGIDMSAATVGLTMSNALATTLGYVHTWSVASGVTLDVAGPLTRAAQSGINFNTTAGGTIHIGSGSVSNVLLYSTINGSDVGALDGSLNVVGAASIVNNGTGYEANAGAPATPYVDFINGATGTAADSGFGGSGSVYPKIFRFNTPQPNRNYWRVDTSSKNNYVDPLTILVTANVGAQDVYWAGSYNCLRWNNGDELVIDQQNPQGTLYVTGTTSERTSSSNNQLTKTGVGRVVWNTTSSSGGPGGLPFAGATRILQGEFNHIDGLISRSAIRVYNGAKFTGNGFYRNGVAVYTGGTLGAGDLNGAGLLVVTNSFELANGSRIQFYGATVPATNTSALMLYTNGAAAAAVSGTVTVDILSGTLTPGTYPLLVSSNGFAGGGTFVLGIIKPHVTAHLNQTATQLDLVIDSVNQPLTWIKGSDTWDLTSPNWQDTLLNTTTYQEALGLGDSVLFEDTLSGSSPITVTVNSTLNPAAVTVNNSTKNYTFSGGGSIGGGASLTKAGSGTLTLGTANTFTGGININGGLVNFSALNNLGAGAISFGGGTLQYGVNTDDISVRTVTFGAGGATINDGGNTLYFANAVGNNGAGGFTKVGSGNLTLNSTNRYSGNTVVAAGTLTLAGGASISNSAAVIVNSGTVLDASQAGGFTVNGAIGQKLAGNGTVAGGVTLNNGASLSPLTNGAAGTLTIANGSLTVGGGTLVMDISSSSRDLVAVTGGGLSLSGGTLQLNVTGTLPYGSYTLISYLPGNLYTGPGSAGSLSISGFSQTGAAATLSDAVDGEIQLVVSPSASDVITWAGVGFEWDLIGTLNWYLGTSTPWAFTNGDYVTFNDVGAAYSAVSLKAAVKPTAVTVTSDTTAYSFNDGTAVGGGKLSGSASLTKNGAALLTVNTVNDASGDVVINGGTLQVNGHLGTGNITNNADLLFLQDASRTVVGSLNGPGNLTQAGQATLTLTADSPLFTGGVTIQSGTLQLGNGGATGSLGTTKTITNNGALILNRAASYTFANAVEGIGALTKNAAGNVTLTASNSYAGATATWAGKLIYGSANAHAGNGTVSVSSGATNDLNGYDLTVAALSGSGRIVNNSGSATNVLKITGGGDCSLVIADNDGSGGRVQVVKDGTGNQYLRAASTYSGGTIIKAGTLQARSQNNAFGTATNVILSGGTLDNYSSTLGYTIETTADSGLATSGNCWFSGPIISPHNITATIAGGNVTMSWGMVNQMAGFTGRMILQGNATSSYFRWAHTTGGLNGSAAANWDLEGNANMTANGSGYTILLGSLEGATTTSVSGNSTTYIVGDKNTNTTYSGRVSGSGSFVKSGTGSLTLDGGYAFTGSTVVSNGTLVFASAANPTNSSTIAVRAGATLDVSNMGILITETNEVGEVTNSYVQVTRRLDLPGYTNSQALTGSGTILGSVAAGANSTINPGDGIGALTIMNALTVTGATVNMELNRTNAAATNDLLAASSVTVNGGTLNVTNLGPVLYTGQIFRLFSQPVGGSGFTTVNLPVSNGTVTYVWNNKLAADGTIELVSGGSPVSTTPTNITYAVSGSTLTLSWPDSHIGWTLQAQTNAVNVGVANNWVDVPGSSATNQVILPVDAANGSVFFRLHYLAP